MVSLSVYTNTATLSSKAVVVAAVEVKGKSKGGR